MMPRHPEVPNWIGQAAIWAAIGLCRAVLYRGAAMRYSKVRLQRAKS
jgi:hypothetical protein